MKFYVLPKISCVGNNFLFAELQSTAGIVFSSCSADNNGCPTLRYDFGSSTTPPDGYQLRVNCINTYVSTTPLTSCIITQVSESIYDVNCCLDGVGGPCCPCSDDNVLIVNSGEAGVECCPCGPPPLLTPTEVQGLAGCTGSAEVTVLDASGKPVSDPITNSDCSSL